MQSTINAEYRILAGIAYCIWPLSILIVATTMKREKFLRYHGYQALFLGICLSVGYLVIGAFLKFIPLIGPLTLNLIKLLWFLLVLFLGYRCFIGDYFRVPLIYDLAQGTME